MSDERQELGQPVRCCVCGHLTPRGQVIHLGRDEPVIVGWCDFDWQRWAVQWAREVGPIYLAAAR
ncbi:MAG: hypothetical protein ACYDDU_07330 [Dermatophilaceae bacterium]